MMTTKQLSLFSKILITTLFVTVVAVMLGRNHFILGTVLILFRWFFVGLVLVLLYLTFKRITSRQFQIYLVIVLFVISLEYVYNKFAEESLKKGSPDTKVSLMTYNIFFRNAVPNSSIAKIKSYDPDILVVQELTPQWEVNLENAIGSKYPYRNTLALRGTHGIGIFSKYPILNCELLKNAKGLPFAQIAELKIKNRKVQLINVHLASPAAAVEDPQNFISHFSANYRLRSQQLDSINHIVTKRESEFDAQLLIGDLNTTPYEPIYRDIKKHWVNLFEVSGKGKSFNFPNSSKMDPVLTLDYLFGRGIMNSVEVKVVEGGSSDHLALAGKIKI